MRGERRSCVDQRLGERSLVSDLNLVHRQPATQHEARRRTGCVISSQVGADHAPEVLTIASELLDRQIEDKVNEIRGQLASELKRLETYEKEELGLRGETDQMLGPVARASLASVANAFRDLVRRADVGIIDVAWSRKQEKTRKVNEVVQRQQTQVQELEDEFSDVLEE